MKIRRHSRLVGSSILLAAIALSGCGAKDAADNAAASASNKASNAISAAECKLASKDVVNQVLGTSYGEPKVSKDDGATLCTYTDANGGTATVRIDHSATAESFAARKKAMPSNGYSVMGVGGVGGVGDEAYGTIAHPDAKTTINGVVVRKGSVEIWIQTPSSIDKTKQQALANQMVG